MDEHVGKFSEGVEPLDAAAEAVRLGSRSRSRSLNEKTEALLEKQGRLVDLQIHDLQAQHHLVLSHLHWGRFSDWMKALLQMLTAIVGGAIVLLVAVLAWQAHEAHGLAIDAFSVPPDLARTGLTGEVAASRFLDKVQALQRATAESDRPPQSYETNWGSDFKVEIPDTGLTFSEFDKLLRERLGNVSHVTGEITSSPAGISLTARLGDAPPQTFTGPVASFDELAQKSAEAVYGANQPYRYAEYLDGAGRLDEAFRVISNLAINGPASERGWAYAKWAFMELNDRGDAAGARNYASRGIGYGAGSDLNDHIAMVNTEVWSGHEEADLNVSKAIEVESRTRLPDSSDFFFQANRLMGRAWLDFVKPDYEASGAEWMETARDFPAAQSGYGKVAQLSPAMAATAYALGHDLPAARRAMVQAPPSDDAMPWDIAQGAFLALPRYWITAEMGRWPLALQDAQKMDATLEAGKSTRPIYGLMQQVWIKPLLALALARTGETASAAALVNKTPTDCYLCVRVRGMIAAQQQDWVAADRWFAAAVSEAPSLPAAYIEWARMRLDRKNADGAIALIKIAEAKNPRDADESEIWGEALLFKGDPRSAASKFKDAAELAPNWGRNRLKWAEALARSGEPEEARTQLRNATGLPLTVEERSELVSQRY
jgi:tetratricopeptide (TPR) repeat protein